ncbi:MAG: D-alanyl-D-alanine carboxypeptidase/D-alanyl-D-alanine-endopeptidase [Planctomycetota bacterium]|nr:MAG: D-alanyl-D-alanine carboxypeptidase/D-alanyl-D-alanine-endopeptidase [Planctomycetota bacterium]
MLRRIAPFLAPVLLLSSLAAQAAPKAPETPKEALAEFLAAPVLKNARIGVCVRSGEQVLAENEAERGFMTASNMKLFSSALALRVLGPAFRFETRLEARGHIRAGVLEGDLVLVGSGDPSFGALAYEKQGASAVFLRMRESVRKAGIRKVTGRVLGDATIQKDEFMGDGWDWSYHADWYAAPVSGLCFNENCLDFIFDGAAAGQQPLFRLEPDTGYFEIRNLVRCVPKGVDSELLFVRKIGSRKLTLRGSFPANRKAKRDWASVDDPATFAATVLCETLQRSGIPVRGGAGRVGPGLSPGRRGGVRAVHSHLSPPLSELVVRLNKVSQNLYAEQLPRRAALEAGEEMSMRGARIVMQKELAAMGVDSEGLVMADGSGLSRLNLVRPRQIADLLVAMRKHEHGDLYYASLPLAGVDGTLRRRFLEGSPARGRVRAKTGYISRVVGLSGYLPRDGGEPWVFSILVNDFVAPTWKVKRAVDRFVERLCVQAGPWKSGE